MAHQERGYDEAIAFIRSQADPPKPDQRVSHADLMAAAHLLIEAARKESLAGNLSRASEINHIVLDTFRAAIRVEDLPIEVGLFGEAVRS